MCTGRGSNQGPLGPKSDALTTAPLRHLRFTPPEVVWGYLLGPMSLLLGISSDLPEQLHLSIYLPIQLKVEGYTMYRKDRNSNGGGLILFIKNDVTSRQMPDLEFKDVESISVELCIGNAKWLLKGAYKPPSLKNNIFSMDFQTTMDKIYMSYQNVILLGDLNFDLLDTSKGKPLEDMNELFDLKNLVKDPTCFMKDAKPSLVDVILTNKNQNFMKTGQCDTGLSDWHNMTFTVLKGNFLHYNNSQFEYRSFQGFVDREVFLQDLQRVPWHVPHVFDDINDVYWAHDSLFREVINEHVPLKLKKRRKNSASFMNCELRRAIYFKKVLRRKYLKNKTDKNWTKFTKQRNLVTKLKRQSIKLYFAERCGGGTKSSDFWPTIRPFLTNKGSQNSENIAISDNGKIITDTSEICEKFNTFFANVAKDIGDGAGCLTSEDHPSICAIRANHSSSEAEFEFKPVDEAKISRYLGRIGQRKATGLDTISSKILHLSEEVIVGPTTSLINRMISDKKFPDPLKYTRVSPIFKKKDPFDVQNWRPVSILPITSKLFERTLEEQLSNHFENFFNPYLSAFRKGLSCQSVLLAITEEWRRTLDRNEYVATILMDLSKAFDCLSPSLIKDKLIAYGLSNDAVDLIDDYLSNRKQCVKIGEKCSSFLNIIKGVPQGSILGPLIFNIFINDTFYFIDKAKLFNYADDNTLSFSHSDFATLVEILVRESKVLIR